MAEPYRPGATKTYGRTNWFWVPTVANQDSPSVTEVTAASAIDVTRVLFATTGKPTQSTNRVTAERRLGDTQQFEFIGTSTVTGGDAIYAFADQDVAASEGKKLYEAIPEGTSGFLVERKGVARSTAPAAGQFVNVYPVEFGPSFPVDAGDGEAGESAMSATFAVTGPPSINKALVA